MIVVNEFNLSMCTFRKGPSLIASLNFIMYQLQALGELIRSFGCHYLRLAVHHHMK